MLFSAWLRLRRERAGSGKRTACQGIARVASKNASAAAIAQRYAGALYELANPQWLDAVAGDLKTFADALDAVPELKRVDRKSVV